MKFMKKKYVTPQIKEYEILIETPMLAASYENSENLPIIPSSADPTAKEHVIIDVWE